MLEMAEYLFINAGIAEGCDVAYFLHECVEFSWLSLSLLFYALFILIFA